MGDLSQRDREQAIAELERIEQTLSSMSAWLDGDEPDQQRCAIMMEDAANLVRGAGWIAERLDPARVAMLAHRRMATSPNGHRSA